MIGLDRQFMNTPAIDSRSMVEQLLQALGDCSSQYTLSIFGDPDQVIAQTMLGVSTGPETIVLVIGSVHNKEYITDFRDATDS